MIESAVISMFAESFVEIVTNFHWIFRKPLPSFGTQIGSRSISIVIVGNPYPYRPSLYSIDMILQTAQLCLLLKLNDRIHVIHCHKLWIDIARLWIPIERRNLKVWCSRSSRKMAITLLRVDHT
ncbi:hypothetical protein V8G54_034911 [Vigna mungo]|uniref:Uncharacterized protein n=1 Tax=Vigna mungo TaxID=3915 RepID=A0AAQ3RE01_VIGMU